MIMFICKFKTNYYLSGYLGIGKQVSRRFGTEKQVKGGRE